MPKRIILLSIICFIGTIWVIPVFVTDVLAVSSSAPAVARGSSGADVVKSASTVQYFDGKTLVLKNKKQYALAGVAVSNLTKNRKNKKNLANVMVAEMTFVNNRLTEVVLTLR